MKNSKLQYVENADGSKSVIDNGVCIGKLMQTVTQPGLGVQTWSQPGNDTGHNVAMYDDASVVNFAAHWTEHYQQSYPLARVQTAQAINKSKKPNRFGSSRFVNLSGS